MNRPLVALIAAMGVALAVPALLLGQRHAPLPAPLSMAPPPLAASPAASIDAALSRGLFGDGTDPGRFDDAGPAPQATGDGGSDDAPAIAGIVGRLPDRAVVLVRRGTGGTRALALGDSVDGWRLEAISADAALFVQGARRVRAELPDGQ